MDDKEYVEALENSLKFMCSIYEQIEKIVLSGKPMDIWNFPKVQGTANSIAIHMISELGYDKSPKYGFRDIQKKMESLTPSQG